MQSVWGRQEQGQEVNAMWWGKQNEASEEELFVAVKNSLYLIKTGIPGQWSQLQRYDGIVRSGSYLEHSELSKDSICTLNFAAELWYVLRRVPYLSAADTRNACSDSTL